MTTTRRALLGFFAGLPLAWKALAVELVRPTTELNYLSMIVSDAFLPHLDDLRSAAAPILELLPRTQERVAGKYIVTPMAFGRNMVTFRPLKPG